MASSRKKPKVSADVSTSEPQSTSSKTMPSHLLVEIPTDTDISLPVWDAMMSQQMTATWTINPYSINLAFTPVKKTTVPQKSESVYNMPNSFETPLIIMQPRVIIQSDAQQQDTSCVMLTYPQNTTQVILNPTDQYPANSFVLSMPLDASKPSPHPQSITPAVTGFLPMTQILPKSTAAKLQGPAILPSVLPQFHTKSSSDINICDKFLLGLCWAGENCDMHHTPYPYHWQVHSLISRQWVDINLSTQVLLEKIYCNVERNYVNVKDGNDVYSLCFDSMTVDGTFKYDGARRLTNSDSVTSNPYFPSKWKIYWYNTEWKEYDEITSAFLLKKMSKKEPECSFIMGDYKYNVDFTVMTQTNLTTRMQRPVRCRPVYCSPDSMQPRLKTGIQTVPVQPAIDPSGSNFNVNPLREFSSWYPPSWCLTSGKDYSLVDVPAGTLAYSSIQNFFFRSLDLNMDIVSIQQVQNVLHWDIYQRQKAYMKKQHLKSKKPLERLLFHGTTKGASEAICHNNFDHRMAGTNGASFGYGSYFAIKASLSHTYTVKSRADGVHHMFLAKVLVGKSCKGRRDYRHPPPLPKKGQYHLYDSCVDTMKKPSMFVVFDRCQCYPYYLIKYKDLPSEIEM